MRFFNTTGPVVAADHYCIPPLHRVNLGEVLTLIREKRYFVLHAPRQTGKTSTLLALRDLLNGGSEGAYRCVYVNVESAQTAREHVERGMRAILGSLGTRVRRTLGDESLASSWPGILTTFGPEGALQEVLGRRAVASEAIHAARERIILRRETHLDQLTDKLQEERVRRVIGPLLSGHAAVETIRPDDLQYVRDLGLVARDKPVRIANPIYREVIPRDLTWTTQEYLPHDPAWYLDSGGGLNLIRLLSAFQDYLREHSEHWVERFPYREAGPQLLLQAFLQRIVNSGGRVEREYGLGRMRTDLLIVWSAGASPDRTRRMVIECKVLHGSLERTIREGLEQTRAYMDRCGAVEGHLVIFDRTPGKEWQEKLFRRQEPGSGPPITVWGDVGSGSRRHFGWWCARRFLGVVIQ